MQEARQFRLMVVLSVIVHLVVLGGAVLLSSFHSQATPPLPHPEAVVVDVYTFDELPALSKDNSPVTREQPTQGLIAALPQQTPAVPSPTPTPTVTPLPQNTPTPRPRPTAIPTPHPTMTPVPTPTSQLKTAPRPKREPTRTPTPEQALVALDIPRRPGVLTANQQHDDS